MEAAGSPAGGGSCFADLSHQWTAACVGPFYIRSLSQRETHIQLKMTNKMQQHPPIPVFFGNVWLAV